jgi:hypothetical protein
VSAPGRALDVGTHGSQSISPFFLRLSALVALELGRETGEEEIGQCNGRVALAAKIRWYLLLAGLITRTLHEGYLTAGWTGTPVQVLLGVRLGSSATPNNATTPPPPAADDTYVEFEPDRMPDLTDTVDVLFRSRGTNANAGGIT